MQCICHSPTPWETWGHWSPPTPPPARFSSHAAVSLETTTVSQIRQSPALLTVHKQDSCGFGMVGPIIVVGEGHSLLGATRGDVEDLPAGIQHSLQGHEPGEGAAAVLAGLVWKKQRRWYGAEGERGADGHEGLGDPGHSQYPNSVHIWKNHCLFPMSAMEMFVLRSSWSIFWWELSVHSAFTLSKKT